MDKAQKRAILTIDKEYVFNDIYFGEEGMTSTSAQHVSAMDNVMVQDVKQHLMGLRLYEKSIRVIGDVECKVEEVNNTLPEISDGVKQICKANALIAWLREAVKEREQAQQYIQDMTLDKWMELQGIEKPASPVPPMMPKINFQDYKTILDTGLTVKEYNRFVELNSALAVYGEMIHDKGLLKSLRPQSYWKPSDEQMKCLDNVKGSDDHNGYVLNTLYNDLKKLREE